MERLTDSDYADFPVNDEEVYTLQSSEEETGDSEIPPQLAKRIPFGQRLPDEDDDTEFSIRDYALRRARELAFYWSPQSTTVRRFSYDRIAQHLHVWFQSTVAKRTPPMSHYVYFNVPFEVFQNMINSQSKGKFVHESLKGGYGSLRLE